MSCTSKPLRKSQLSCSLQLQILLANDWESRSRRFAKLFRRGDILEALRRRSTGFARTTALGRAVCTRTPKTPEHRLKGLHTCQKRWLAAVVDVRPLPGVLARYALRGCAASA